MDTDLFGEPLDTPSEVLATGTYTAKACAPIYEPKNRKPHIPEFLSLGKYHALIAKIEASTLPPAEKEFLRFAATRHVVFNYALIADYYAHSSPEMQALMEDSALVLIDFEDAIRKGYVRLSKAIEAQVSAAKGASDAE